MLKQDWKWSRPSLDKLNTVDLRLRNVVSRALEISPVDLTVVWGWRGEEHQGELVESGHSKSPWPTSKHNHTRPGNAGQPMPNSLAVDLAPLNASGIPWEDTHYFAVVAGCMFAAAAMQKQTIRWGGDWDMDGSTEDQTFMDWGHFEIVSAAP